MEFASGNLPFVFFSNQIKYIKCTSSSTSSLTLTFQVGIWRNTWEWFVRNFLFEILSTLNKDTHYGMGVMLTQKTTQDNKILIDKILSFQSRWGILLNFHFAQIKLVAVAANNIYHVIKLIVREYVVSNWLVQKMLLFTCFKFIKIHNHRL